MELTSKEAYEVLGGRSEVDGFLKEVNGKFGKWASVTIEPNIPEEDFEPEEFGQESDYLKVEIVLKNGDYSMYDKVGEFVWGWFDEHGLDFSHDDTYAAGKDIVEAFVVKTPSDLQQEENTMKKLNITKEQFNKSRYFKNKYGELEYVSENGKVFKTNKGKIMKFKESSEGDDPEVQRLAKKVLASMKRMRKTLADCGIPKFSKTYKMPCGDRLEITLKSGRDDSVYAIGGGMVLTLTGSYGTHIGGWGISIRADAEVDGERWINYPKLYNHTDRVIEAFNIFLKNFSRDFKSYIRYYEVDEFDESSRGKILKFKESLEGDYSDELDDGRVNAVVQKICNILKKCKWVKSVDFDDVEDYFEVYTTDGGFFTFFG